MENYSTLLDALAGLRQAGYTENFNLRQQCIECRKGKYKFFSDEFIVDKFYRFKMAADPSDESVIYAISSEKYKMKGVLINSYGVYSEPLTNEMFHKLKIVHDANGYHLADYL